MFSSSSCFLSNCGKMLRHFESWDIQHIFREKNGLADWIFSLDLDIQFFDSAPIWASFSLADDLLGITRGRLMVKYDSSTGSSNLHPNYKS